MATGVDPPLQFAVLHRVSRLEIGNGELHAAVRVEAGDLVIAHVDVEPTFEPESFGVDRVHVGPCLDPHSGPVGQDPITGHALDEPLPTPSSTERSACAAPISAALSYGTTTLVLSLSANFARVSSCKIAISDGSGLAARMALYTLAIASARPSASSMYACRLPSARKIADARSPSAARMAAFAAPSATLIADC